MKAVKFLFVASALLMGVHAKAQYTPVYDSTHQYHYVRVNPVLYKITDTRPVVKIAIQYPQNITYMLVDSLGYTLGSGNLNIGDMLAQMTAAQDSVFATLLNDVILKANGQPVFTLLGQ